MACSKKSTKEVLYKKNASKKKNEKVLNKWSNFIP